LFFICHPSPKAEDLLLLLQLPFLFVIPEGDLLLAVPFVCHSAAKRRNLLLHQVTQPSGSPSQPTTKKVLSHEG
jgi:hypothetical protein